MRLLQLLILPCLVCAQERSQFVWQGEVEGIVLLSLRDNRLDLQVKEGTPVARPRFHFYGRLPEIRQDARLEIREGRGYVHIVDQPRLENHYTLAVSIEDRQPGSSFYSIALYWDASSQSFEGFRRSGRTDKISWSGRVDQEAIISCQARSCTSVATLGAPVMGERFKFSRPLPNLDVEVRLEETQGRGEIRLAEQPSERNNYTTRVSIHDPQSGAGEYSFTLLWTRPSGKVAEPPIVAQRGLIWTGVVDGHARITIQGGSAFSEAVQGRAEFLRPLPSRSDLKPVVKKLRGRGRVEIVEYPSGKNNYRLVFEITDSESGADTYEIEVDW